MKNAVKFEENEILEDKHKYDPLNFLKEENVWNKESKAIVALTMAQIGQQSFFPLKTSAIELDTSSFDKFNPDTFRPVCPTSDTFYRFLQNSAKVVVGEDNFVQFGPLIAEGLLRIRLELCVVESYAYEAVVPFVQKNGLSWVLPLHETVETFLAGTIFGLATTFILVGSTKLVTIIVTYTDVFVGAPCRFFGGFAFDRARGKPVTLDIGIGPWKARVLGPKKDKNNNEEDKEDDILDFSNVSPVQIPLVLVTGSVKTFGETSKIFRQVIEGFDLFVGRYLVLLTTAYIGFKFVHFKFFP